MDIDKSFDSAIKYIMEAVGDHDKKNKYKWTNNEWELDNPEYAFDYDFGGFDGSVYVAYEDATSYTYVYIFGEKESHAIYRISNNGMTIRKMVSSGKLDDIKIDLISDILSIAGPAIGRSKLKANIVGDDDKSKMPYRVVVGDVIYEAVQYPAGSVANTVLELDSGLNSKKPEDLALDSFKSMIIAAASAGAPLKEVQPYGYADIDDIVINSQGVFTIKASVEMPDGTDGEPKRIEMTIAVTPKDTDLVAVADAAFNFEIKNAKIEEKAEEASTTDNSETK